MKDWVKVFLAFAAIIGGVVWLFYELYYRLDLSGVVAGVLLIAGGASYFWMNCRFYKR
jgi:hypothetical protein